MNSGIIRKLFYEYFQKNGHSIVKSAPIVIKDDPSLMFTNAGMNQFKDIFLGTSDPDSQRVANSQKCLRVSGKHNDIEDVGYDTYHHTMFEMLGNWSFGDYFKKEAIKFAWELITEVYNIDKSRIYVTVFGGDKDLKLEADNEALEYWKNHIDSNRILYGDRKDNFWEMGDTGPCGPCSEIHVDIRDNEEREMVDGRNLVNKDHPEVIEIWNLVFIQFNKKFSGNLEKLPKLHVDTGMGFERLCMVLQNKKSNYDTDVFQGIIQSITDVTGVKYGNDKKTDIAIRVVGDHLRAVCFAIADGQIPSNVKAGYVIRRILRRAIRFGFSFLNMKEPFINKLVDTLVNEMGGVYTELVSQKDIIKKVILEEEKTFLRTLEKGIKLLDKKIEEIRKKDSSILSGKDAFVLYDTYGFPVDLTKLILKENSIELNEKEFEMEMEKQKSRARTDADTETDDWINVKDSSSPFEFVGYEKPEYTVNIIKYRKLKQKSSTVYQLVFDKSPFYAESGGQVGDTGYIFNDDEKIRIKNTITEHNATIHISDKLPENIDKEFTAVIDKQKRIDTARNHSATHLLHYSLRSILGEHVEQKGSLVDENRLRFDFSHFNKLENNEIREIEKFVNSMIRSNRSIEEFRNLELSDAKEMGALSLFGEKYGDKVRVIKFGDAVELCGGTHVNALGEIGFFKITTETSIAAGIRRIEAVTGLKSEELVYNSIDDIIEIKELFKGTKDFKESVKKCVDENAALRKGLEDYKKKEIINIREKLIKDSVTINDTKIIKGNIDVSSVDDLKELTAQMRGSLSSFACVLGAVTKNKPVLIIAFSEDLVKEKKFHAGELIRETAKLIKGGGGGQPYVATAGGSNPDNISDALKYAFDIITEKLS